MSQANWSPTTGLNVSNCLPNHSSDSSPRCMNASPPTWATLPQDDLPQVAPGRGADSITFGSLQLEPMPVRPRTPPVLPSMLGSHSSMGAVWVANTELSPEGHTTYSHDTSHPSWRTKDDYKGILDWRYSRCITDDRVAVEFNGVCDAARSLNGLSHQSDPLPWCRDGTDPAREAHASAKYNVHVLRKVKAPSSSGEDECLRKLLVDSDEDQVPPGPSVEHLISVRRQSKGPPSVINTPSESTPTPTDKTLVNFGSNGLIRKGSPVKLCRDLCSVPITRPRLDPFQGGALSSTEEVEEPPEPVHGTRVTDRPHLIPGKAVPGLLRGLKGNGVARGLTRAPMIMTLKVVKSYDYDIKSGQQLELLHSKWSTARIITLEVVNSYDYDIKSGQQLELLHSKWSTARIITLEVVNSYDYDIKSGQQLGIMGYNII
ncbi:hypothetical protein DFH28DRAFT_934208 [Melampsora americana]|nr:hypothetical protein DFH28DRAFT_934208 [Melampsora americana]